MHTPLLSILNKHKDDISFHTPAHCGGIVGLSGNDLLKLDTTELTHSDNLLHPTGVIKMSLDIVNNIYGASATTYVTGGATSAIHTAIRALKNCRFLVVGETHKSVFNALRINHATSYYIDSLDDNLKNIITKHNINVVIVTSPNYFGATLDLQKIACICHNNNAELFVDASHGAHFVFCDKLPVSATKYGDWVIHSCHKTLAVPTGGAILHYPKERELDVHFALNEVHSSSPSYMMMIAMEHAICTLAGDGQTQYNNIIEALSAFKNTLDSRFSVVKTDDPTRLVISSKWVGRQLYNSLEQCGISAEMQRANEVVFIVTPANYKHLPSLSQALKQLDTAGFTTYKSTTIPQTSELTKLNFSDSFSLLPLEDAVGKVCYHEVGLYPPGTALLVSGEIITKEKAELIINLSNFAFGLVNDAIAVVK